jgi:hypothetical protein
LLIEIFYQAVLQTLLQLSFVNFVLGNRAPDSRCGTGTYSFCDQIVTAIYVERQLPRLKPSVIPKGPVIVHKQVFVSSGVVLFFKHHWTPWLYNSWYYEHSDNLKKVTMIGGGTIYRARIFHIKCNNQQNL